MKKLYIIFVNFNSGNQLYNGVESVLKIKAVSGVIVVDNASHDNSISLLKKIKQQSKITIIKNNKNIGFNKAVNLAIKNAISKKADMVMPLDFDLDFSKDFISRLLKIDGDMVAPVLKFKMDEKWLYDYGGRVNWKNGSSNHLIKDHIDKTIGPSVASMDETKKNWFNFISGGCTIIKISTIKKIGFLDEDYFVYWGDAEFSIRATQAGLKVVMDGSTIVHHKIEISRQTKNINKLKISFFDNMTFIRKRIKWYFKPIAYLNIFTFSLKLGIKLFI